MTDRFRTPYEARMGGAETMFPDYIEKMLTMETPPNTVGGQYSDLDLFNDGGGR